MPEAADRDLIDWPALLDQRCSMRLVVLGQVPRSDWTEQRSASPDTNFGLEPGEWFRSQPSKRTDSIRTPMAAPIVLMLDGDVGFMVALSQELTARDISAYPARTVREARSMLQRFRLAPDVLVIDCTIDRACSFAKEVAEQLPNLGILGIASASHHCEKCADLLAKTLSKPDDMSPERIPYCADVIQRLLRNVLGHDGHANATH